MVIMYNATHTKPWQQIVYSQAYKIPTDDQTISSHSILYGHKQIWFCFWYVTGAST